MKSAGKLILGSGVVTAAGGLYGTRLETEWLELKKVEIPIKGLDDGLIGFRIVLLSDFHLYPHTRLEFINQVISESNRLDPDLVVLLGDFVLGDAESIFDLAPALARLNAQHGVYSVLGNHDIWKNPELIAQVLNQEGLKVLDNEGLTLSHQSSQFYLAGVDDGWSGQPDLPSALVQHRGQIPVILLAHEPDFADLYSRDQRVSLQLSGHSHGGQVRIPGYGSPFLPPYGKKYPSGLYRVRSTWLYSNVGIGVTVPIRLNCRPEITEVTLIANEET